MAVKYIKLCHHFTYIIPSYPIIISFTVFFQFFCASDFLIVIIKVYAGIHAAFDDLEFFFCILLVFRGENKDLARHKALLPKVLLGDRRADVVGVDLLKAVFL